MESDWPLVLIKSVALPQNLKKTVTKDLRSRGLMVNKAQESLNEAVASDDLKQVAALLDEGLAQINRTSIVSDDVESHCWTPLHVAAQASNIEAASLLLERGADVNFSAYKTPSLTPLMLAVMSSAEDSLREKPADLVNLLIEHGIDVNQTGPGGERFPHTIYLHEFISSLLGCFPLAHATLVLCFLEASSLTCIVH